VNNFVLLREFAPLNALMSLIFFAGIGLAIYDFAGERGRVPPTENFEQAKRFLLLLAFVLAFCAGLIITRASPASQSTYYTGLVSLQWVLVAYPLARFMRGRVWRGLIVLALVVIFMGANAAERITRITRHDDAVYSRFNIALYRHIDAAANFIAADWNRPEPVTISYDVLPEMDNLWWVLPWHTVDALYRMGTPFDLLLELNHGLLNTNQSADGLAEAPDYIVVYTPGLDRYDLTQYEVAQFGTIYVLKKKA
jgi:hypothetical protein